MIGIKHFSTVNGYLVIRQLSRSTRPMFTSRMQVRRIIRQPPQAITSWMFRTLSTMSSTITNKSITPSFNIQHCRRTIARSFSSLHVTEEDTQKILTNHINPKSSDNVNTTNVELPDYLRRYYWWAYINPTMIYLLDRQWLVDIVLWGNFTKLRNVAVNELVTTQPTRNINTNINTNNLCTPRMIHGNTLQLSCVYANLTETLIKNLAPDATLHVVDVVPAQLTNLQQKLRRSSSTTRDDMQKVKCTCCDAAKLYTQVPNDTFDNVLIFFLLHETPSNVRQEVLSEACRVLKHNGKLVIIDYHKPTTVLWRYVMQFMYQLYEPFAIDLWNYPLASWFPPSIRENMKCDTDVYFGGLYQKVVVTNCKH